MVLCCCETTNAERILLYSVLKGQIFVSKKMCVRLGGITGSFLESTSIIGSREQFRATRSLGKFKHAFISMNGFVHISTS